MSNFRLILSIALLILSNSAFSKNQSQPQPDQIIEIFRHGARSPLHNYDASWPPAEAGDLTPVGMRQHFVLGKALAEKYPNLLGTPYNFSQIYVMTDYVPRCVQSVTSHLYGIYLGTGPALRDGYPAELAVPPFQDPFVQELAASLPDSAALPYNMVPPIINIINDTNAYLFESDNTTICANTDTWQSQNYNDSDAEKALIAFGPTIANLNQHLADYMNGTLQINTLEDLKGFGDVMMANIADNRTIPGGIEDPDLIRNLTYAFSWIELHVWAAQKTQRQTHSYGLLEATIQQLQAFRQGENYNTVALFSGHDENLFTIWSALGLANEECVMANFYSVLENNTVIYPICYYPIFASNVIVEFYNSTDAPYVKFYYNNQIVPLCDGQETCSLDEFISRFQKASGNMTILSYFKGCGTNATQMAALGFGSLLSKNSTLESFIVFSRENVTTEIMIIMGLVVLVMMLIAKVLLDNKKYNKLVKEFQAERFFYSEIKEVKIN